MHIYDGKKYKTKIIEHSGEIAKRSSGYRDGFYNFDSDIWKAKLYSQSIKILSEQCHTMPAIDVAHSISVDIDEDDSPIILNAGDVSLQIIKNREATGYKLVLRPYNIDLIFKFLSRFFRRKLPLNLQLLFICNFLPRIHFIS